jgi:hypothetical protein
VRFIQEQLEEALRSAEALQFHHMSGAWMELYESLVEAITALRIESWRDENLPEEP